MDTSAMEEKRKEIENAEEAYKTLQKYKGIMAKGNDYYEKGQYDKAIEQYRKAKETEKSRAEEVNEKIDKCKEKKKELADAARQEKMSPLGGSGTTGGNTTVTPSPPVGGNSWNNGTGNNSNYNPSGGGSSNTTQKNSGSGTGGGSTSKPSIDFTVIDDENYDFSVD